MAEPTATATKPRAKKAATPKTSLGDALVTPQVKDRFGKAIEEAKAGAQAVRDEALNRAGEYRDRIKDTSSDWIEDARAYGDQARDRAGELAVEGKAKATEALKSLGGIIADNAGVIDEKLGLKYGDYARSAAKSIDGAATKLDAKELGDLAEDAKEFVRKSPGLAIGIAAVAGFALARLFKGSDD